MLFYRFVGKQRVKDEFMRFKTEEKKGGGGGWEREKTIGSERWGRRDWLEEKAICEREKRVKTFRAG